MLTVFTVYVCYGLDCVPPNSCVEVLAPSNSECVNVFGKRAFKKAIKLKWGQ